MSIHCRKLIYRAAALFIYAFLVIALLPCGMAGQIAKPIQSHEVHSDGTITFRYLDTGAKHVEVSVGGLKAPVPMTNTGGVWTATTPQLPPEIYWYYFIVDGQPQMDPLNGVVLPNYVYLNNVVVVPGATPQLWEATDVPHGELHHHFYKSAVANDDRDYYVYTPPGYDASAKRTYPVLYLLHGFSDDASGWIAVGRANVILDNLIAQGRAKPMIVVMPLGYGTMEFVRQAWNAWSNTELRDLNFAKFTQALLTEVMPQVENEYRITKDRNARAIAGLSMGGSESLLTGLNNLDKFSWVGAFSSGGIPEDFQKDFPALDAKANQQLHLFWIACGTEDRLITINRNLREWLKTKGVKETGIETPGMHSWMVWRRNLAEFAGLLFR